MGRAGERIGVLCPATKPPRDALKGMAFAATFERRVYDTSIGMGHRDCGKNHLGLTSFFDSSHSRMIVK